MPLSVMCCSSNVSADVSRQFGVVEAKMHARSHLGEDDHQPIAAYRCEFLSPFVLTSVIISLIGCLPGYTVAWLNFALLFQPCRKVLDNVPDGCNWLC
jgi:hypothetical protein